MTNFEEYLAERLKEPAVKEGFDAADRPNTTEYPVGRCTDECCHYPEPHRHGFDCDRTCLCAGVGAETAPLEEGALPTCDWGYCSSPAVAMRNDGPNFGQDNWLSVCSWHAGWDDYHYVEGVTS